MEQIPKLEVKAKIESTHDLLNLSFEEKEELKKSIEKWNGLVRIFVHPLYEKWRPGEYDIHEAHRQQENIEIEKVLSRILSLDNTNCPPIIIMQEDIFMSEFKKWLKKMGRGLKGTVYMVETVPNNPVPKIGKGKNLAYEKIILEWDTYTRGNPAWKTLENTLKEVGARKILLGGIALKVSPHGKDWTDKYPFMEKCVGIAMSHLSKDKGGEFEVQLSALTAPFSQRSFFNKIKKQ